MAKRIYAEGNFVKVDTEGEIKRYPANSYYRDENGTLTIYHPRGFQKGFPNPGEWLNAKEGGDSTFENRAIRFEPEEPRNAINAGDGTVTIKLWYKLLTLS